MIYVVYLAYHNPFGTTSDAYGAQALAFLLCQSSSVEPWQYRALENFGAISCTCSDRSSCFHWFSLLGSHTAWHSWFHRSCSSLFGHASVLLGDKGYEPACECRQHVAVKLAHVEA